MNPSSLKYLLMLLLALAFLSCSTGDCDHGCMLSDESIGRVHLQDTSRAWVPYQEGQVLTLENNKGYKTQVNYIGKRNSFNKGASRVVPTGCCPEHKKFLDFENERINLLSEDSLFYFSFGLDKFTSNQLDTSLDYSQVPDMFTVRINRGNFQFPLEFDSITTYHNNSLEFLPTLNWGDSTYHQVMHVWYTNIAQAVHSGIKGVYYSKNYGLIGFYQENGDLWTITK